MTQHSLPILFIGIASLTFSLLACVPAKEYRELDEKYKNLTTQNSELEHANDTLSVRTRELRTANNKLLQEIEQLVADTLTKGIARQRLEEDYRKLQANYDDLEQIQKSLIDGSQRETSMILAEIQRLQQDLQQREDAVKELERQLHQRKLALDKVAQQQQAYKQSLDSLSTQLDNKNQEYLELKRIMSRKDSLTDALRKRVADALFGFEGKGLTIHHRNGRVYVSLEEQLMFKTGSYDVDSKGQEAIRQLIPVLEQNPDINVQVEGHTDDVPMRGSGPIADNWDLSAKRATSIVRILLEGSKIPPSNITAAGRAEFQPLETGTNVEARQKNRRTEIILTPKMGELLEALGVE